MTTLQIHYSPHRPYCQLRVTHSGRRLHWPKHLYVFFWVKDANDKPSASRSLGHCPRDVSQQFYVGTDRFVVRNVFLSAFLVDLWLQLRWAGAHILI